jgi:hypothetical protein
MAAEGCVHAALLLMQQGRLSWVDANVQAAASTAGTENCCAG